MLNSTVAADGGADDNYPARVHATLDLLDRHLMHMKEQLIPKPVPGRAPPKKVVSPFVSLIAFVPLRS